MPNCSANENLPAAAEAALTAWEEVYSSGGELDRANRVLDIGVLKLHELSRYELGEEEQPELARAIRLLRFAISDRHNTVQSFIDQAVAEQRPAR